MPDMASLMDDQITGAQEQIEDEERYLWQVLRDLQISYERSAQPYIDRLVLIHNTRPSARFLFDCCCSHGIHVMNACGACVPPRGTTV